jgi:hypothetical protein
MRELGRILIVKLESRGTVDVHIDEGRYAEHYSRFHIALSAEEGSMLIVENDSVHMQPGEAWWFDHRRRHAAHNASSASRIHLIFDAVTERYPAPTKGHAYGNSL